MRSLRSRLFLSTLLPILIVVPVAGLVLNTLLQTQVVVAGVSNELIRQAVLVSDMSAMSVEIWQDPAQAQDFVARVSSRLTAKLMLLDPQGKLIVSSDPTDARLVGQIYEMPDLQRLLAQDQQAEVRYNQSQITDVIVPVVTAGGQVIGFVRLSNPLAGIYARSQQLGQIIVYVVIGGVLAGLLLGILLARDLERPLKHTSAAIFSVTQGQLPETPLREEGPQEVRVLQRSFNLLIERLKTSEESRRRLLANVVHELGRPLGTLLSALQALLGGADEDPSMRREMLKGMENELFLLRRLLEDLAHIDHGLGGTHLDRQDVDLAERLPLMLHTWEKPAEEKKIRYRVDLPPTLPIARLDPERIDQALGNLIGNAIRYTPAGGSVEVRVSLEEGQLSITISDDGPGIPLDEQERIFQPFYRGKSAKRFSEGMGLGLTIARDIIIAHNGSLTLESEEGRFSRFKIVLPLEQNPPAQ